MMKKLSHSEIVTRQKEQRRLPKLSFCVILNNIRSLYNVGSIVRTSDGVGVEKVWVCGYTGRPDQGQAAKTALGAQDSVQWEQRSSAVEVICELKAKGYQIVLLEQMEDSTPYEQFVPQSPVCLILGNEIEGIDDEIVKLCDVAIDIEMSGIKNSLNVAVAFGVVAYHFRKLLKVKI